LLIRPARLEDAAEIATLSTELGYPTSEGEMKRRMEKLLQSNSYFLAVAENESRVIARVAAEKRLLLESGERAEIVGLIVTTSARRSGTGLALVKAAEAWAVEQGMPSISVRSNVARVESHPFYERLGYVRTKTQHAYAKQLA